MTFKDELITARDNIVGKEFILRDGIDIPATAQVGYDQAVKVSVTYLYADMADSSGLVAVSGRTTVGKVIRLFLDLSVRIINHQGGEIRSFDGDRVMGIFIGDGKETRAVRSALQIAWACDELIQPKIVARYPSIRDAGWVLKPGCGVATGDALIIRGGVRQSDNDLVSIGLAPNLAAKLSDQRKLPYMTRIDEKTYRALTAHKKVGDTPMWSGKLELTVGGKQHAYRRSSFRKPIS